MFISGNIGYGSYFKHVLSFYEHHDAENLLMVAFEKLHGNRKDEILRIAKFLGEPQYTNVAEDDAIMGKVIEHTGFDYMKKNLYFIHPNARGGDIKMKIWLISFEKVL